MASLISSVPGIYEKLDALLKAAGEEQDPRIPVFSFELGQYEPAGYVFIKEIKQQPYEWEAIGAFTQKETYDICGEATVFSGDSQATNPEVVQRVIEETYALFQNCVMTPVMSNRDMPILGTTGPTPYLVLPWESQPDFGPAEIAGGQAGWYGKINWSFHFEALITPT
jgi:hypothetical protein